MPNIVDKVNVIVETQVNNDSENEKLLYVMWIIDWLAKLFICSFDFFSQFFVEFQLC